jgi:hypothetical protein
MRIAISALVGMAVVLPAASASAEAGAVATPAPPAAVPAAAPPEGELAAERIDLVGWHDAFFLRDAHDVFRFYPHLLVEADFYSSFGPGVSRVPPSDTATDLKPRLSLRRAQIGFDAELLRRWSVTAIMELGGQAVASTAAGVQTVASAPAPADVFIGYSACACFNVQLGQLDVPFSMANRTPDDVYPLLERPVAIRNFVVASQRDVGGIIWGELGPRVFAYELGVFGGSGQNRPALDASPDVLGRVFVRPFAGGGTSDLEKHTQIGVSARHGDRDPRSIAYDSPAITTGQGFALWEPRYTDSLGRLVHVIPAGAQDQIGGELRLQVGRFALQTEAYYVVDDTREALDGAELTSTARSGRMLGTGWYAELSAWPLGDAFLTPEPGIDRPRHLDLASRMPARMPYGIEMLTFVSGINASYRGATRLDSKPDPKTPMGDLTVYQIGLVANYWHTKHVRFGINYAAYVTPASGTASNEAVVPSNLTDQPNGVPNPGHVLHELSARLAATF